MGNFTLSYSGYNVIHKMIEPSKVSDYDYDPYNEKRRFYTTFFHTLEFKDPITDQSYCKLFFPTEVCQSISSALFRLSDNPGVDSNGAPISHPLMLTIKDVFMEGYNEYCLCTLNRFENLICMNIIKDTTLFNVSLDESDVDFLINDLQEDYVLNYIK